MKPESNGHTGNLRFSAFVPAQLVNEYFTDERKHEALRLFTANRISKVYLDCLRGGHFPGEKVLVSARDFLYENGIQVSAGLTPTRGTGKGCSHEKWWLCYTNKGTQEEIESIVRRTARIFDEIIVDDFLCTHCQCSECQSARGDRNWAEYYRELLSVVAQERIISPAKAENPDIKVIIKYPQWYDRFHVFGYDVFHHPRNFDEVWVGTEIRDPLVEYVHQYQAFANYRWLASISGDKIGGGWFDFIYCYPEIYVEQAVQSILAGARELVRFHYQPELFSTENPNTRALLDIMPQLEELARLLDGTKPQGIAYYKPPSSEGDDEVYLLDYLGMLGLPIVPCHDFPKEANSLCLSIHSVNDPDIVEQTIDFVNNGGNVLLTPGFIKMLAHDERILRMAGYDSTPVTDTDIWTFRFSVNQSQADAESHVHFSANLHPSSAEVLATGIHPQGNFPVLTRKTYGRGKVLVLNAKTFRYPVGSGRVTVGEPVSLPNMPQSLVDILRSEMLSGFPFNIQVRSRVGIYWYGDIIVFANFNDQSVKASISEKLTNDMQAEDPVWHRILGDWKDCQLSFDIPARQFAVISF